MTEQDKEILLLAERIRILSTDGFRGKGCPDEDELFFRINKIRELANTLVPRIEAQLGNRIG